MTPKLDGQSIRSAARGPLEDDSANDSPDSAKRLLEEYGTYLRMVVRRRMNQSLRAKFDSDDVMQSVWIHVLSGLRKNGWRFESEARLRSFLGMVTNNRLTDRIRRNSNSLRNEVPLESSVAKELVGTDDSASQTASANDLWARMQQLCPVAHRPILELRRSGLSLAEIAERLDLHEGSVRRILYDLARRLGDVNPGGGRRPREQNGND